MRFAHFSNVMARCCARAHLAWPATQPLRFGLSQATVWERWRGIVWLAVGPSPYHNWVFIEYEIHIVSQSRNFRFSPLDAPCVVAGLRRTPRFSGLRGPVALGRTARAILRVQYTNSILYIACVSFSRLLCLNELWSPVDLSECVVGVC